MKIENVKLDWNKILEPYVKYLATRFPEDIVRQRLAPVVDSLNANRMKSMAILSDGKPAGYAFFMEPGIFSDRLYASVGFVSPELYLESRLGTIMEWLIGATAESGKKLLLNEVFNAPASHLEFLQSRGFRVITRLSMTADIDSHDPDEIQLPPGFSTDEITAIDLETFSDLEFAAYIGTPDEPFFSSVREDRIAFTKGVLIDENYGRVIFRASFVLKSPDGPCGAVLVTSGVPGTGNPAQCLLANIFLLPEFRGRGLSRYMMSRAIKLSAKEGFTSMSLMVNKDNHAKSMYRKFRFVEDSHPPEYMILYERQ